MAHDHAILTIITRSWRLAEVEEMAAVSVGPGRARVLSFRELADLIQAALADGEPSGSLLEALLDVEEREI